MDDDLLLRAHGGDREAFALLYNRYCRGVYDTALERLMDASSARDAVKQVFSRLYRQILDSDQPFDVPTALRIYTQEALRAAQQPVSKPEPAPEPESESALRRVRARMAERLAEPEDTEPAPETEVLHSTRLGNAIITGLIALFFLLFLWILAGILMDFEILPRLNLGYAWFNRTFFRLFSL